MVIFDQKWTKNLGFWPRKGHFFLVTKSRQKDQKWPLIGNFLAFWHFWPFLWQNDQKVLMSEIVAKGAQWVTISTDLLIFNEFPSRKFVEMCLALGTKVPLKEYFWPFLGIISTNIRETKISWNFGRSHFMTFVGVAKVNFCQKNFWWGQQRFFATFFEVEKSGKSCLVGKDDFGCPFLFALVGPKKGDFFYLQSRKMPIFRVLLGLSVRNGAFWLGLSQEEPYFGFFGLSLFFIFLGFSWAYFLFLIFLFLSFIFTLIFFFWRALSGPPIIK